MSAVDGLSKKDACRLQWLDAKDKQNLFDYEDEDDLKLLQELWDLQAALADFKKKEKKKASAGLTLPMSPSTPLRSVIHTPGGFSQGGNSPVTANLATPLVRRTPPVQPASFWEPPRPSAAIRIASPELATTDQQSPPTTQQNSTPMEETTHPTSWQAAENSLIDATTDIGDAPQPPSAGGAMIPWPEEGVQYRHARPPQESIPEPTPLPRRGRAQDGQSGGKDTLPTDKGYAARAANGGRDNSEYDGGWGGDVAAADKSVDDAGWGASVPSDGRGSGSGAFINPERMGMVPGADRPPRSNWDQRRVETANDGASRGGFGGGSNDACFKCGEPGHFSRECPQAGGGARGNGSFKCGQDGHFSRECPEGGQGGFDGGGGGGNRDCYKCGQPGHISRDCPASTAGGGSGRNGGGQNGGSFGGYGGGVRDGPRGGQGTGSNAGARDSGWGARGGGGRDQPPPHAPSNGWSEPQETRNASNLHIPDNGDQWGSSAPAMDRQSAAVDQWCAPAQASSPNPDANDLVSDPSEGPATQEENQRKADDGGEFGGW